MFFSLHSSAIQQRKPVSRLSLLLLILLTSSAFDTQIIYQDHVLFLSPAFISRFFMVLALSRMFDAFMPKALSIFFCVALTA